MKNKKLSISIIISIISLFACLFFYNPHEEKLVAAASSLVDCYYVKTDGDIYKSSTPVGVGSGESFYIIGSQNAVITVEAKPNFQLVGWNVTYEEQGSGESEYFDLSGLTDNKKTIELTAKDGVTKISAELKVNQNRGYFVGGEFKLSTVFEHLKITPVFDHIYYNVDVSNFFSIVSLNKTTVDGVDVYHKETQNLTEEVDGIDATKYVDAIIKNGDNYHYYGDLLNVQNTLKTEHYSIDGENRLELVDYSLGAFRVSDIVEFSQDIKIIENDYLNSKNIDLLGVTVSSNSTESLPIYNAQNASDKYYSLTKDSFSRTKSFNVKFNVQTSSTYLNTITLNYHNLYLADIKLIVEDEENTRWLSDILGVVDEDEPKDGIVDELNNKVNSGLKQFLSNISTFNYYSIVDLQDLKFFIKNRENNSGKSFTINSVNTITRSVEGRNYTYFNFVSLDGASATTKSYPYIAANVEIEIEYEPIKHNIDFNFKEYISSDKPIIDLQTEPFSPIQLNRGDTIHFSNVEPENTQGEIGDIFFNIANSTMYVKEDVWVENVVYEPIDIIGYDFVGFDSFENFYMSYTIDLAKPQGKSIDLCFKKTEFNIQLANYNKEIIQSVYPINAITVSRTNSSNPNVQTILNSNFGEDTTTLSLKFTLGEKLTIQDIVNNGFIVKYSLKSPDFAKADEDYITELELTTQVISTFADGENITIYIYEEVILYTLTYYIDIQENADTSEQFVMAQIGADTSNIITKYDLEGNETTDENAQISKLVISGLKMHDQVLLTSAGNIFDIAENVTYMFRYFTEDGKSTLSVVEGTTNHLATITGDKTIKVVYSVPGAQVTISLENEYSHIYENLGLTVLDDGEVKTSLEDNMFVATVDAGSELTISLSTVPFGYEYVGYAVNGGSAQVVDGLTFTHTVSTGENNFVLVFKRIIYRFYIHQFGASGYGELPDDTIYNFGENDYIEIDIDHLNIDIVKPEGYYIASVRFGESLFSGYSTLLSENNTYSQNSDIINATIRLNKDIFEYLAKPENDCLTDSDSDGINEVYVRIDYLIFTYEINIEYQLTNSDINKDSYLKYPLIELKYNFEDTDYSFNNVYATKSAKFQDVPYGVNASLTLMSGVQPGVYAEGWRNAYDNPISTQYKNAISLNVTSNQDLIYKLSYEVYGVNLQFDKEQGEPVVYINGEEKGIKAQISLFDNLLIIPKASQMKGYKFDSITYYQPQYTPYVYDLEDWELNYNKLYILYGNLYTLNTSESYNSSLNYFTYEEVETVHQANGNKQDLVINSIDFANFIIKDGEITFTINYKYLELKVENIIFTQDGSLDGLWDRYGAGDRAFWFDLNDMISFQVVRNGEPIDLNNTITIADAIKVKISINKEAKNIVDGKNYDLSLGLVLNNSVNVANLTKTATLTSVGEYLLEFEVLDCLTYGIVENDIIKITYSFTHLNKSITVTSIVKNNPEFYNNARIELIDADENSENMPVGYESYAFVRGYLTKANVYMDLFNQYSKTFIVSGYKIYVDNNILSHDLYEQYGIFEQKDENDVLIPRLVSLVYLYNIKIEFLVQPKITFMPDTTFEKEFKCTQEGVGVAQGLISGEDYLIDSDINVTIKYQKDNEGFKTDSVTNVGMYYVYMSFSSTVYPWVASLEVQETVTLEITKKIIYLDYYRPDSANANRIQQTEKPYDGSNVVSIGPSILNSFYFYDNNDLKINYVHNKIKLNTNITTGIKANISLAGKDAYVSDANEGLHYNLYVHNIALFAGGENSFNNNFDLKTSDMIIYNYIKINKKELELNNIEVYSKVYDGTDLAEIVNSENITISGLQNKEKFIIDPAKLVVKFENNQVGTNKTVIINGAKALIPVDSAKVENYKIKESKISGLTIYPYMLTTKVEGFGEINLINERGKLERDKINLIPLNAMLSVEMIYPDSVEYAQIYSKISNHLKGNKEFAVGFKLKMYNGGNPIEIDRNLYISMPKIKNINGAYFLMKQNSSSADYKLENNRIVVDLRQSAVDIEGLFITQEKVLLKVWQIVLIVIAAVLIITAVVLTFVIIRKRKRKEYSVHEKI